MEEEIEKLDFWTERLKVPIGSYNSAVDMNVYNVAKAIVDARKNDTFVHCTDIAAEFSMSPEHVELIQYILAGVQYKRPNPKVGSNLFTDHWTQPFTYGTSPRCLFVDDMETAEIFLKELESELND